MAFNSLRDPTPRRFGATIHLAIAGSFTVSTLMAVFGYLTFFEDAEADIFVNYERYPDVRSSPVMNTARLLVALNMVITYPSELMVARHTIESLLRRRRAHTRWLQYRAPAHDLALVARLKAQEAEEAAAADNWRFRDGITLGLVKHVAVTAVLFSASLGIALATDDLGQVLGITGSFTAVFLAFVLPAAIRLRLGPTSDDTLPLCHRRNWPAWAVIALGAVAFVTSTGFSVLSLATGENVTL
jgi:amino acid permease